MYLFMLACVMCQPVESVSVSLADSQVTLKLGNQIVAQGIPSLQNYAPAVNDYTGGYPIPDDSPAWGGSQVFGPLVLRSFSGRTMSVRHEFVTYTMTFTPLDTERISVAVKLLNKGTKAIRYPAVVLPPTDNSNNEDAATSQVDEWSGGQGSGETKFVSIRMWRRLTSAFLNYAPLDAGAFQISAALAQHGSCMHLWRAAHEWVIFPTVGRRYLTVYQDRLILPGETWTTKVLLRISRDTSWQNGLQIQKENLTTLYGKPSDNYPPLDTRPTVGLFTSDPTRISPADPLGNQRTMGVSDAEATAFRDSLTQQVSLRNCAGVFGWANFACYPGEEHYAYDSMDVDNLTASHVSLLRTALEGDGRKFGWLMRPEIAVRWNRSGRQLLPQSHPEWLARSLERWPTYGYQDTCGMGQRDIELLAALRKKHGKAAIWFPEFPTDVSAFLTPGFFQASNDAETSDAQTFYWTGTANSGQTERIRWLTDGYWWGLMDAGNMDMAKRFRFARELGLQPCVHSYEFHTKPWPPPDTPPLMGAKIINPESDTLAEVNAARAKKGLKPFIYDAGLEVAAKKCAELRAASLIAGHLPNDFAHVPQGTTAKAAGCGALEPSWGWGTCCMYDNYTYAGAAVVMGKDGRRYMHLFVR